MSPDAASTDPASVDVEVVRLGTFVGARSGDKGGNANVGVWVRDPVEDAAVAASHAFLAQARDAEAEKSWQEPGFDVSPDAVALADARYEWLRAFLTVERLRALLPETAPLAVDRYELPNLRALNFVVVGLLGRGVAETTRRDPQAKGLGEHLRARLVPVPRALLDGQA